MEERQRQKEAATERGSGRERQRSTTGTFGVEEEVWKEAGGPPCSQRKWRRRRLSCHSLPPAHTPERFLVGGVERERLTRDEREHNFVSPVSNQGWGRRWVLPKQARDTHAETVRGRCGLTGHQGSNPPSATHLRRGRSRLTRGRGVVAELLKDSVTSLPFAPDTSCTCWSAGGEGPLIHDRAVPTPSTVLETACLSLSLYA